MNNFLSLSQEKLIGILNIKVFVNDCNVFNRRSNVSSKNFDYNFGVISTKFPKQIKDADQQKQLAALLNESNEDETLAAERLSVQEIQASISQLLSNSSELINKMIQADRENVAKPSSDTSKKKLTDLLDIQTTLKPIFNITTKTIEKKLEEYKILVQQTTKRKSYVYVNDVFDYDAEFFVTLERLFIMPLLFFFPTNIRISKIECEFFELENENNSLDLEKIPKRFLSSFSKYTHRYSSNNKGTSTCTYYFKNGFLSFKIKTGRGLEKQLSLPSPAISEDIFKNIPKTADVIVVPEQYPENKTEMFYKFIKHNDFILVPYYQIENFYYPPAQEKSVFADKFFKKSGNKKASFEPVNMLKNEQKASGKALRNVQNMTPTALDDSYDEGEDEGEKAG